MSKCKEYDAGQSAKKVLKQACIVENRKRNRILSAAVAAAVTASVCIMSLLFAKTQAAAWRYIREDGAAVSAYLENGTGENAGQLESLSYVRDTGLKKYAGKLFFGQQMCGTCVVLDETAYQKMLRPAFLEVQGDYPRNADEIMLSATTLKYLGIDDPEPGMQVSLEFYWNDLFCTALIGEQKFILSGYYESAHDMALQETEAYISEKRLKACAESMFPCRILIDGKDAFMSGNRMEERLSRDIPLQADQHIVSLDSAAYRALEEISGGSAAAVTAVFVILMVLFMLVYSVLYVSMDKDIRQYGLMRVLGMPQDQIRSLIFAQVLHAYLWGAVIGTAMSVTLVGIICLNLVNRLYEGIDKKSIGIFAGMSLAGMAFLTFAMVCIAAFAVFRKLLKMDSIQATKYENDGLFQKTKGRKRSKSSVWKGKDPIVFLAWMNLMRSGRKFFFVVVSLAFGCEAALASAALAAGTDRMNLLTENPDFTICVTQEACIAFSESSEEWEKKVFLDEAFLSRIAELAGVREEDLLIVRGFLPIVDKEGRKSLQLLNSQNDPIEVVLQMNAENMDSLAQYVKERAISMDLSTFADGSGTVILHKHLLSETLEYVGKRMGLYDMVPVGTDMSEYELSYLINCGYLDVSDRKVPIQEPVWNGENVICFMVSENTWDELDQRLTEQIVRISFHVDEKNEPEIKSRLKRQIDMENAAFGETGYANGLDLLSLECNSDVIAKEQKEITGTRFLMGLVSLAFCFTGIMSYFNMMLTDMVTRKREFAIMKGIGITNRQIRSMLMLEGMICCCAVVMLLGTLGTFILWLVGIYMKSRLPYFKFYYPFGLFFLTAGLLMLLCVLVPRIFYREKLL